MKFWIDCEWNDYKGSLISMALVAEDGAEWYEVLECKDASVWVCTNVLPKLGKAPTTYQIMQNSLVTFLSKYPSVHIIADWPEDIKHFCDLLIVGPGQMLPVNSLSFKIESEPLAKSELPHNALSDAHANRKACRSRLEP